LPQLKGTPGFRTLDDPEKDFVLEYPKSWVGRANRQRQGLSVSDYNVRHIHPESGNSLRTSHVESLATLLLLQSSDKLVVEVFPQLEQNDQLVPNILQHLISPGQEVGGDSRLIIPSNKNVVTDSENIGGQV